VKEVDLALVRVTLREGFVVEEGGGEAVGVVASVGETGGSAESLQDVDEGEEDEHDCETGDQWPCGAVRRRKDELMAMMITTPRAKRWFEGLKMLLEVESACADGVAEAEEDTDEIGEEDRLAVLEEEEESMDEEEEESVRMAREEGVVVVELVVVVVALLVESSRVVVDVVLLDEAGVVVVVAVVLAAVEVVEVPSANTKLTGALTTCRLSNLLPQSRRSCSACSTACESELARGCGRARERFGLRWRVEVGRAVARTQARVKARRVV
jgi:hypothetical protein